MVFPHFWVKLYMGNLWGNEFTLVSIKLSINLNIRFSKRYFIIIFGNDDTLFLYGD